MKAGAQRTSYDIESEVERFHWWFAVRRSLVKSLVSSMNFRPGDLVLDVGCGVGSNLRVLEGQNFSVIGLDKSYHALRLARERTKCFLINADLSRLPIHPGSIDLVLATDVLEHLDNDIRGVRSFHEVLRDGGALILTVPAFQFLWGLQDVVTGHKRRYAMREIQDKIEQEGFSILRCSYFNFFLFFPILMGRCLIRLLGVQVASENDINSRFLNFFLKMIFSTEPHILKYLSFPFGVSMFLIALKRNK